MKRLLIIAALCAFCIGAAAQEKRYEIKSGIVTTEMSMMGQNIVQKMYFDDYGAKHASISEFGGQKMRSIDVDGKKVKVKVDEHGIATIPCKKGQTVVIDYTR